MRSMISKVVTVGLFALAAAHGSAFAGDRDESWGSRTGFSVMGGVLGLNQNNTGVSDQLINVPVVGTLTYELTRNLALEPEFTWMIPVEQDVEVTPGVTEKRKSPDVLAYQGNLRASLPMDNGWTPYAVGGLGAMTFVSATEPNRMPQLAESQTVFAINFGAGVTYALTPTLGLRADFREFAAFPGNDAVGLSASGNADTIWMERGAVGVVFRY